MKLAKTSIALLVIQLAIVSSIAAKYLYQRWTCPRVWTRTVVHDPELRMRGRYLSLELTVDGCQSTLPSAKEATFQRTVDGSATGKTFRIAAGLSVRFPTRLKVEANRLIAIRIPDAENNAAAVMVEALPGASCDALRLETPVDFYLPEHTPTPGASTAAHELWVEVTVPPTGPPRPLQLALKENGAWKPLAFQ